MIACVDGGVVLLSWTTYVATTGAEICTRTKDDERVDHVFKVIHNQSYCDGVMEIEVGF